MDLDFSNEGEVEVTMISYLKETIKGFPEEITGTATTPASLFLFNVNENAEKLNAKDVKDFHTAVAKLLFVIKRARGDIITAVSFLSTRVKGPDVDDWKKLVRLLKYVNGTIDMRLTLSTDNSNILKWWADGSFAVHADMKSQAGGTFSMGKGSILNISTKQKLVTRSSTEAELVAANDIMPQLLWTKYFLECQGYNIVANQLYQDNLSAILLEKNGKWSSSKRTKHINIRFFFIKDRIDAKDLGVYHCPTDNMTADFHTKA